MKLRLTIIGASLLAMCLLASSGLMGCASASSTTPPAALAPGYLNLDDQQMAQIISGARTFYNTIQCETQTLNWSQAAQQCVTDPTITAPLVLSATEKAAFNDFGLSLNIAEVAHLSYHNGTGTTLAAAEAATTTVKQKQSALPALAVTH